ncbi:hypothetical protein DIS24_g6673 [Lasiodiplodia hormozganensis]|uniref:Lipocalin-like domain-containing protein n=1 Tax=Lasiodiplodia hormozganensis TaxID=869390 RepID=A0AA39YDM5_9PEZI|nr:hypothetical protein DIS24_g6673 [Lasiodiplodia hormozganensis]
MSPGKKALKCLVGAWGYINATLYNTATGDIVTDDWGYPVPSGMELFTPNGYTALIAVPNDRTHPELRPAYLNPGDPSSGTDAEWALIGKNSLVGAGPFHLSDVTDGQDECEGPQGIMTGSILTSTLPGLERPFKFSFKFYDDCSVWVLHEDMGEDLERVVWYYAKADQDVYD